MKLRYGCVLIIILIFLLTGCSVSSKSSYIEDGELNIEAWDFAKDGILHLDGKWELYWSDLLHNRDLPQVKPDLLAEVPASWDAYSLDGERLSGVGYATYRLHVKTSLPANSMLGIRAGAFSSAYRLYVNDKLIAANGTVGTTSSEEVGEYRPQVVIFNIPAGEFDIIIHVSNYHYARGGFWNSVFLGSPEGIAGLHDNIMGKELFLLGALLIIAFFNIAIYLLKKELKYPLYFALFCLSLIVTMDMVGQHILLRIFSTAGINMTIFLWYASITWSIVFLQLFIAELFPSGFAKNVARSYIAIACLELTVYFLTPPVFYTKFGYISNYVDILGVLFTVVSVAIGIRRGYKDGWLNIVSMLILLSAYIHDVLYTTYAIRHDFGKMYFGGLFIFIFLQMVIQAQRIKVFHEQKTTAELAFLQAQIKPHFLFNSLNTIISVSQYDIDKARSLLRDFSQYLRKSFDFKYLNHFVPLKHEVELAKAYVAIEKARFEERMEVTFDVPANLETRVPMLMLQPIIENAVIHGILPKADGGRIDVSIREQGRYLVFTVTDNGVGMNEKEYRQILQQQAPGVGLANINRRLREFFGKGLDIKSCPAQGTIITWSIPAAERR